jgi:hypothetical protein
MKAKGTTKIPNMLIFTNFQNFGNNRLIHKTEITGQKQIEKKNLTSETNIGVITKITPTNV